MECNVQWLIRCGNVCVASTTALYNQIFDSKYGRKMKEKEKRESDENDSSTDSASDSDQSASGDVGATLSGLLATLRQRFPEFADADGVMAEWAAMVVCLQCVWGLDCVGMYWGADLLY